VPPDSVSNGENVREFPAHSDGLEALGAFLLECGVKSVAMEATGIYWFVPFTYLESLGLEVCLINPRDIKQPKGRKSDVADCQWIQQLHSCGLLIPSFVPEAPVRDLRGFVRMRGKLVQDNARNVNHMVKALRLMNVQLEKAVSDITGKTGIKIIEAIIGGEFRPYALASLRDDR
jgi:transposase